MRTKNTPEANAAIIAVMQSKAQLDMARAEIIRNYQMSEGKMSVAEAQRQLGELEQKIGIPAQVQQVFEITGGRRPSAGTGAGVVDG